MIRTRIPGVRQQDQSDCGPACLSCIFRFHRLHHSIAVIRQWAGTNREGTHLAGLIRAAGKAGLNARAVRARNRHLPELSSPVIAHMVQSNECHHFVVVDNVRKTTIRIMDPASGNVEKWTRTRFNDQWSGVLLLLEPDSSFSKERSTSSRFQRLIQLIRPHRVALLQALTGAVFYTLSGLSMAIFLQIIVDHIIPDARDGLLRLTGFLMITILVFQTGLGALKSLFVLKTGQMMDATLISGYYRHLLRLPQSFFDGMQQGELISRLNDAVKIRLFINDVAIQLAVNLLTILFSMALLMSTYWKLGLFLLLILPCYAVLFAVVNRWNRQTLRETMERSAKLESRLIESLRSIRTIKLFGLEERETQRTERTMIRLLQSVYRSGIHQIFATTSTRFVSSFFTIATLWFGTSAVLTGNLTAGELLSFYAVIGYFTGPAAELTTANRTIQDASIASDRLFELLELKPEQKPRHPLPIPEHDSPVRFERVTFRYGLHPPILNNCNLVVQKGEVTAITGESGCGKSTIFSLIQGLYPIEDGFIRIQGEDLRNLDPESLRTYMAVVPQSLHLFSGTLLENIALGDPDPDLNHLLELFQLLKFESFLTQLPNGFETRLGDDGQQLSGGQQQKVALARALYRDPTLLLLDEATSFLDRTSEQSLLQSVQSWCTSERSVLLITHRWSTLRHADRIHLLRNGAISESGTREDLMQSQDPFYRQLRSA
ncbi:MAG: peptidase domain-containing ABC transporter [Balneolaceae bacterium]